MAGELGFTSTDLTLLATAISEVARNITAYAGAGEVRLRVVRGTNGREGIEVVAATTGPASRTSSSRSRTATRPAAAWASGCPAPAGWSTSSSSRPRRGRGRPCAWSSGGAVAAEPDHWPAELQRGIAAAALQGERHSGDRAVFVAWESGRARGGDRRPRPRRPAAVAAEEAAKVAHEPRERRPRRCSSAATRRSCARAAS